MLNLFQELKRRNVYRVATGYAVVSWLLIQVAATLFPVFSIPENAMRLLTALLLIGFVITFSLAWFFELTPTGIKKTLSAQAGETSRTGPADFLFGSMSLLIVGFLVVRLLLPTGSEEAPDNALDETILLASEPIETVEEERLVPAEFSIAVLPLANLSPDPDNAFFAAGIHEEILNQLVKARQLQVTSRTSVLRFENSELSIQEIARQLNVSTIMEGSVRFAGNEVRITTQLIRASDDVHLWSETYQREYEDVFAIQSDVAIQVANALHASLTSRELANIEREATNSIEAYTLYLQAKALESSSDAASEFLAFSAGTPLLERAIELDPSFAQAYASLAFRLQVLAQGTTDPGLRSAQNDTVINYAEKAIEIDPDQALAYTVLARLYWSLKQWDDWLINVRLSVEVPSIGADAALSLAYDLSYLGQHEAAYHWINIAIAKDPDPSILIIAALMRVYGGDYESSLVFLDQYLSRDGREDDYHTLRALAYHFLGRDEESFNELNQIVQVPFTRELIGIEDYLRCQTTAPENILQEIGALRDGRSYIRHLSCALGASDLDRVFRLVEIPMSTNNELGLNPSMIGEAKQDPRWQAVEDYMGLPELTEIQIPY